ncbi:oxygen-independent coproporphyrinogen III oxidase family protein, putative [Plesiocystis pacifica SIR-1]|uniref:Oxygen-independent coproporphyrinogen III oxidase family protein, putative n=1 Tax=Plesiocystis pacifica SIR-1 TaxID=391625 RepID=A6GCW7_9BACT|nr:B12-binding domain-containing radical SAM protein [Plesiocystis pacifica]EDM76291.1 oxygen-independent coproporphyrinogen III oxidase family protein, putative [Plesiocystis pacifica SIR-1]
MSADSPSPAPGAIVLATLNAKYIHAAFGLRYLQANMGPLRAHTQLREFTILQRPLDIAEALLEALGDPRSGPRILGLGVYIWNVEETRALVELLRRVDTGAETGARKLVIVVGGPEVSHELDEQPWLAQVDYVITGEGDRAFPELCARLLDGRRPLTRVLDGGLPDLDSLTLPYALYTDHDLSHRVVYVEASRGCPYRCEFCLSSLDKKVRAFPLEALLGEFDSLLERGARHLKFVDRTFNLDIARSRAILEHFLARLERYPELFLHFELVPDRLPEELRELIARFPPGSLQFEVGIQTLDDAVGRRISRRQRVDRTFANLEFLRERAHVHLHTDLIIGLPGEDLEGFGAGLDRLIAAGVQEVQVGVLKRLRGTPIVRHAEPFGLVFEPRPPYAILRTDAIDFPTMQRLRRFAQVWDNFWNHGDMPRTMAQLWRVDGRGSPFAATLAFSDWLFARAGRVHAISLINRARYLCAFLVEVHGCALEAIHEGCVAPDFEARGKGVPQLGDLSLGPKASGRGRARDANERQRRHASG